MKLDKHYKKVLKLLEQDYGEEETWHDSTKELVNDTLKAVKKLTIPFVSESFYCQSLPERESACAIQCGYCKSVDI